MKASDLNLLLHDLSTTDTFKQLTQEEVSSYSKLMEKKGSNIPLIFDEDEEIILDRSSIRKLLVKTSLGKLTNVDLAYICDCLTLSEKVDFKDEKTRNIVFGIADPEINGGYKSNIELRRLIESCDGD